jgi:hypothetical protein
LGKLHKRLLKCEYNCPHSGVKEIGRKLRKEGGRRRLEAGGWGLDRGSGEFGIGRWERGGGK